jgi:hypothetical protein
MKKVIKILIKIKDIKNDNTKTTDFKFLNMKQIREEIKDNMKIKYTDAKMNCCIIATSPLTY